MTREGEPLRAIIRTSWRPPGSSYSRLASFHRVALQTQSRQADVWKGIVEGSALATVVQISVGTGVVTRTVCRSHCTSRARGSPGNPSVPSWRLFDVIIPPSASLFFSSWCEHADAWLPHADTDLDPDHHPHAPLRPSRADGSIGDERWQGRESKQAEDTYGGVTLGIRRLGWAG